MTRLDLARQRLDLVGRRPETTGTEEIRADQTKTNFNKTEAEQIRPDQTKLD